MACGKPAVLILLPLSLETLITIKTAINRQADKSVRLPVGCQVAVQPDQLFLAQVMEAGWYILERMRYEAVTRAGLAKG